MDAGGSAESAETTEIRLSASRRKRGDIQGRSWARLRFSSCARYREAHKR
jgi:hypothetical protein